MNFLLIREYRQVATDRNGNSLDAGLEDGKVVDQVVPIPGKSEPFQKNTKFIRLSTDSVCNFAVGQEARTKGAGGAGRMVSGQTELFGTIGSLVLAVVVDT